MHIARDAPDRADRFVDRIYEKTLALVDMPAMGVARDDLGPGLRALPFRDYIIFYRDEPRGVIVVRVLHGARDIGALF